MRDVVSHAVLPWYKLAFVYRCSCVHAAYARALGVARMHGAMHGAACTCCMRGMACTHQLFLSNARLLSKAALQDPMTPHTHTRHKTGMSRSHASDLCQHTPPAMCIDTPVDTLLVGIHSLIQSKSNARCTRKRPHSCRTRKNGRIRVSKRTDIIPLFACSRSCQAGPRTRDQVWPRCGRPCVLSR